MIIIHIKKYLLCISSSISILADKKEKQQTKKKTNKKPMLHFPLALKQKARLYFSYQGCNDQFKLLEADKI